MLILNEFQIGLVTGFIKSKNLSCPLCKGQYLVQPEILELKFLDENEGKSLVIGGPEQLRLPVVGIVCQGCHSYFFISAVKLGLFPSIEEIRQKENGQEESQEQKPIDKMIIN